MSTIQYTIRNVPPAVDKVIRKRAAQSGKSFNHTVVELLTLQTFGSPTPLPDDNFDWLFNADTLDTAFDQAQEDIASIDEKLWQ